MALVTSYPLIPGTAGQIVPHSPQRSAAWQLSAWPEKDPECRECTGLHQAVDSHQEVDLETKVFGPPEPEEREHANLQRVNQRMMHVLHERNLSPQPRDHSQSAVHDSRRRAFQLFQSVKTMSDPREFIYGFDLQQAFEAAEIFDVDEYKVALLRQKFGLMPGDIVHFRAFDAMCDMLLAGFGRDYGSPPRDMSPPVPGSPDYQPGPKEKPRKENPPPRNGTPWHVVMDEKMQVPQKARIIHDFDHIVPEEDKPAKKGRGRR
ncbi:hypothetical protein DIPPA_16009 [Diplonema papillatum]|nr:hypothetical protein DIPPA_16009 [Diplonema papillatum]